MLALTFLLTALLYASVGFGGGSTYSALLVLAETDFRLLPSIALICNLTVVSGGCWRFARAGHLHIRPMLPWLATSLPAAWVGGRMPIAEIHFIALLGFSLLAAGLRLSLTAPAPQQPVASRRQMLAISMTGGLLLGLLAGLSGIGGGIFLAPLLYLLGRHSPREIAANCSLFILVNSAAGLSGQVMKLDDAALLGEALRYWPLVPAVLIGGQIGSWLSIRRLNPLLLQRLTALLILYVAVRLLWRWLQMLGTA